MGPSVPLRVGLSWLATQTTRTGSIDPMALVTFMDFLPTPVEARQALIAESPCPAGNPVTDNMLAGLAETLADESGLPTPAWCVEVEPLPEPLPMEGTPQMLAEQRETALPRFRARGITMPRGSLFRDRPAMDAR